MMQRLQDMFDQLRGMFPDKEALKKKLAALEKNVSIRADLELALSHQFSFKYLYDVTTLTLDPFLELRVFRSRACTTC